MKYSSSNVSEVVPEYLYDLKFTTRTALRDSLSNGPERSAGNTSSPAALISGDLNSQI